MATRVFNLLELSWAAGFFDGEGGTYVGKGHYFTKAGKVMRYRMIASVSQKDNHFPIERFGNAVQIGVVRNPDYFFQSKWYVHTFEEVQATIAILWKFLCPRKRQQYKEALLKWRELNDSKALAASNERSSTELD